MSGCWLLMLISDVTAEEGRRGTKEKSDLGQAEILCGHVTDLARSANVTSRGQRPDCNIDWLRVYGAVRLP